MTDCNEKQMATKRAIYPDSGYGSDVFGTGLEMSLTDWWDRDDLNCHTFEVCFSGTMWLLARVKR